MGLCVAERLARGGRRVVLLDAEHPIRTMMAAGVRPSLSVDNLTLSGDDMIVGYGAYPVEHDYIYCHPSGELAHARVDVGLEWAQIKTLLMNGMHTSFSAPPAELVRDYEAAIDAVLAGVAEAGVH